MIEYIENIIPWLFVLLLVVVIKKHTFRIKFNASRKEGVTMDIIATDHDPSQSNSPVSEAVGHNKSTRKSNENNG